MPFPEGKQTLQAVINFATASTNVIVGGVAGQRINVMKLMLVVAGATNLTFEDGTTPLTGAMSLLANGSMVLTYDGCPWFTTSIANGFAILSSNPVQVSGSVQYQLAPG